MLPASRHPSPQRGSYSLRFVPLKRVLRLAYLGRPQERKRRAGCFRHPSPCLPKARIVTYESARTSTSPLGRCENLSVSVPPPTMSISSFDSVLAPFLFSTRLSTSFVMSLVLSQDQADAPFPIERSTS